MSARIPRTQRGAAALAVTVLLLFVMALAVGLAHRNLLFEQRSSANQLRSTRAFEAAEAGLAWAQALLDRGGAIGADCRAADAVPGDTSFRDRYLAFEAATGTFVPRNLPGRGAALQAACVASDDDAGWACSCPADSAPALDTPDGGSARPAFFVRFEAAPRAGMVQLVAAGCDHLGPACEPAAGASFGAAGAQLRATLALLPALAALPGAALSARGAIDVGAAPTLANTDGAGVTANAGGAIALPAATLVTAPGRDAAASLAAHDTALAGLDAERLLTRVLGIDRARWQRLPGVRTLDCSGNCAGALAAATAPETGASMLDISGDMVLDGPLTLGSPERPLLLVVEGQAQLRGGVTLHGVLVTRTAAWDTSGSVDAEVRGAVVALGDVRGNGTPTIVRDAAVLAQLHGGVGHFVRVGGSWRDF
jgi:hypothetical protein